MKSIPTAASDGFTLYAHQCKIGSLDDENAIHRRETTHYKGRTDIQY
jgi:hypothetical protein